jgi:hypothetical protein
LRLGGDLRGSDAATFEVDARHTSAAPIISASEDAARARIGTQAALNAIDVTASFRVLPGTRFVAGVDNLFDHAPDGWLSVIGRRVRLEIRVNQER